jgi:exopolyphosphatase / guanosine-5'-triphosphate,3'-diphosphate pyrophosphatase
VTPTERLACIDIGSNTTRLLIADRRAGRLTPIRQERVFTRIGEELLSAGRLGPSKVAEVAGVVRGQLESARAHGVREIRLLATAAIRGAANGDELVSAIREATGEEVEILSDREEARLAFVGVAGTLDTPPRGELGVIDVGGGSSELVVGQCPDRVRWWASLPLGSAVLCGAGVCADPPTAEELDRSRARIAQELEGLEVPHPATAVAAGGSATSLGRLIGSVLDPGSLRRALGILTTAPAAEVGIRFGIDPVRARLLPTGLLILEAAATAFGVPLRVGGGGIREGVLLEA